MKIWYVSYLICIRYDICISQTHTTEYDSAVREKGILLFTTMWMDHEASEDIMLRETCQTEKVPSYCMVSLTYGIYETQTCRNRG